MIIRSVKRGDFAWQALFDIVMNPNEHLLYFHVGHLVVDNRHFGQRCIDFFKTLNNRPLKNPFIFKGGELLTRCSDKDVLPDSAIGKAFSAMPQEFLEQMFPRLLEAQMRYISTFPCEVDVYYSINLEKINACSQFWKESCDILRRYGHMPINLEIKENAMLSQKALEDIASICVDTGMRVYIDDFASQFHELPKYQEYMSMIINILRPHIKAIKIDYMIMHRIVNDVGLCKLIESNLSCFAYMWYFHKNDHVDLCTSDHLGVLHLTPYYKPRMTRPLPWVIFESMPPGNPDELSYVEKNFIRLHGYRHRAYQVG